MQQPGSNDDTGMGPITQSSSSLPTHFLLLDDGSTDSDASYITYAPDVGLFTVQPIRSARVVLYLAQRLPSDDMNQQDDYSFLNTPMADMQHNTSGSTESSRVAGSSNSTAGAVLIRHTVQPNTRLVALLDNQIMWGSPPTGKVLSMGCVASHKLWPLLQHTCVAGSVDWC
jgi:hypothetical protein